ncbi:invasion associated locus B family protein [Roseomonas sp. AR75]|uniref:invasion associated locus B family protein n=1 Tax=Roseomonas sp. AR75 TaxID=2562311 RepID=UPI0010BF9F93|nr:invasion associated locus B family protein [Roseomonas sp. AR75]
MRSPWMRAALPALALLIALPAAAQQRGQAPVPPPAPAPAPAAPTPPGATQSQREAWQIACGDPGEGGIRPCQLSANIVVQPQNRRIARIVLMRQPATRSLGLVFQVPHGVLLPAGMSWQVDNGEVHRIGFQTSDADGVFAGVPVTDDLLASLRRATVLRLSFAAAANRETVTMPVPMAQFSDSVDQFFAAERRPADPAAVPTPPPPAPAPRR